MKSYMTKILFKTKTQNKPLGPRSTDWKATLRTSNQKRGNQKNGFWLALTLVYHLPQIPRNSCSGVNGKRFFGSSYWKFSGQMEIMVVYHLQKDYGKIQFESNLMAGTWLFGEQQNIWTSSPVFPDGIFQTEIHVPLLQRHLWYQFQNFMVIFW